MRVGDTARRSREVGARYKPIACLRTTIANQDDVVVLDGTALGWREPLGTE